MTRSSKELAKRLRFLRMPQPDFFRRRYWLAGIAVTAGGFALWLLLSLVVRERQFLPGPVSQNHATFGDRCDACHTSFASVRDESCLVCHAARIHSDLEVATPACRDCHVEHRSAEVFLAVGNRSCVTCHGSLETARPSQNVEARVATFAAHPPFTPLREGASDKAALRFNHRVHLGSSRMPVDDPVTCASCHRPQRDGLRMEPIVFETHCQRCHRQDGLGPLADLEALHETPEVVREDLRRQLLVLAVDRGDEIFRGQEQRLPGIRARPPADTSATLAAYEDRWLADADAKLYEPFEHPVEVGLTQRLSGEATAPGEGPSLLDEQKYCFLCHVGTPPPAGDGTASAGLAQVQETRVPARWLLRGEFSHRAHDMVGCATCHDRVEQSVLTADVNLPANAICGDCHVDGSARSAGTGCMLCHLYHDTSKDLGLRAARRKEVSLDVLHGR
jgi:hypothetical protein